MKRGENVRPDIDLARTLVEKEHVLDEHHTTALGDSREKTVEDTSREERVEVGGSRAPCCCTEGDAEEVEHDGKTTKVGRQHNGCGKYC